MSEPFLGEIRMFGGNFAPRGWAFCDGQLLSIASNSALFSLFGTIYGGDGRTTFGLPELRGRVPMHLGSGPGLTPRSIGARSGAEQVSLTSAQMPSHTHNAVARASSAQGDTNVAAGNTWSQDLGVSSATYHTGGPTSDMAAGTVQVSPAGSGSAHDNMQPYLAVSFIVALVGIFPSRS